LAFPSCYCGPDNDGAALGCLAGGGGARSGAEKGVTIAICFRCPLISQSSANEQAHRSCAYLPFVCFTFVLVFIFFLSVAATRLMREQDLSLRSFVGQRFGTMMPDVF